MIENVTEYNNENLTNFIKVSMKKSSLITLIASCVIVVCGLIELLFKEYIWGALFIGLGLFFVLSNVFIIKMAIKKSVSAPKVTNKYEFYPNKVKVQTIMNNEEVGNNTISLYSITKVVEYKGYLYLYISNTQAFIVNVNSFKDDAEKEVVKRYIEDCKTKNIKK